MVAFDEADNHSQIHDSMSVTNTLARALRTTRQYVVGILLLLVVVILWTVSNFITQAIILRHTAAIKINNLCTLGFIYQWIP